MKDQDTRSTTIFSKRFKETIISEKFKATRRKYTVTKFKEMARVVPAKPLSTQDLVRFLQNVTKI